MLCSPVLSHPPQPTSFPYTTLFRSSPLINQTVSFASGDSTVVATDSGATVFTDNNSAPSSGNLNLQIARRGRAVVVSEDRRSEEHTSELQSLRHLVCRLLLEKKKTT